jgi:hypothetical protein
MYRTMLMSALATILTLGVFAVGCQSERDSRDSTTEKDAAVDATSDAVVRDGRAGDSGRDIQSDGVTRDGTSDTDDASPDGADGRADTSLAPTFDDVKSTFKQTCADSGICHKSNNPPDMEKVCFNNQTNNFCAGARGEPPSDQEMYEALIGQPAGSSDRLLVDPGNPDNSEVVHRLELPSDANGPMPPPNGGLPEEKIDRIRAWIAGGARR